MRNSGPAWKVEGDEWAEGLPLSSLIVFQSRLKGEGMKGDLVVVACDGAAKNGRCERSLREFLPSNA